MALVQGIHHVCIKCPDDRSFEKTKSFYMELIGLPVYHAWGDCVLLGKGTDNMEIIKDPSLAPLPQGVLRHIAFDVTDTDRIVELVRHAGYPITVEPKTVTLGSNPGLTVRIAFCNGPMNEEIEFFQTIR